MTILEERTLRDLESKSKANTVIDAGHYSYLTGPTELDVQLWRLGVKLYSRIVGKFQNVGLMLIVDDMNGVKSNAQRRGFDINKLPDDYLRMLNQNSVSPDNVRVLSQNGLRHLGKKLADAREIPTCELISATSSNWREREGYDNAILIYDEQKTDGGINLIAGAQKALDLFGTKVQNHCFIFRDSLDYSYVRI